MKKFPLLDIQLYYQNPSAFVEQIRKACHNVGFFLLKHDIPPQLAERQLKETKLFFQQPLIDKLKISYENNPSFRGYMKLGVENTAGITDAREQVEFATESFLSSNNKIGKSASHDIGADKIVAGQGTWPPYERLRGTNPWPDSFQPELRNTTEEYVDHACRIAHCVREALCLGLGLEKGAMDQLFGKNTKENSKCEAAAGFEEEEAYWQLKLVSYPPLSVQANNNDNDMASLTNGFGVGAHTDTNFLTFVLQDTIGGLQAFSRGTWYDVPSNFGSQVLVCNIGEQAEIISRGYFLATPHRVLANTQSKEQRISVPFFYNPRLSSTIQPLDSIHETALEWERPKDYEKERHWRNEKNTMLSTVGENLFKSLARSHPKVFQRYHNDLSLLENGQIIQKEF